MRARALTAARTRAAGWNPTPHGHRLRPPIASAQDLVVRPSSGAPFAVGVRRGSARVVFRADGADVHVTSPLIFDARLDPADLSRRAPGFDAADGRVHLGPEADLAFAGAEGDQPLLSLRGLEAIPDPFPVPCDRLRLTAPPTAPIRAVTDRTRAHADPASLVPDEDELLLHAAPGDDDPLRVRFSETAAWFVFQRLDKQGEWTRISAAWSDGTALTGWVATASVSHPRFLPGRTGGRGSRAGSGRERRGGRSCCGGCSGWTPSPAPAAADASRCGAVVHPPATTRILAGFSGRVGRRRERSRG